MDMSLLREEWTRGKTWIDNFTRDFPSLENLADGVAISNQKNAPQVGTTTLMNSVRQIPRNSVQDVPVLSAQVNGTKLSVDAIVASFLLRSVVFNEDTFGNGILSTMQMGAQTALTVGFVPLRANVGKVFDKFSTMLETLHYNDVVIEPGVFDASNSRYYDVRTRVTKGAFADLIRNAKANKQTNWNVKALEAMYAAGPQSFDGNRYVSTPKQNAGLNHEEQFDFITRCGVGPYYSINVFSPQQPDDDKPLMSIKSKSKFGYPRISFLVIDPAQLSPFGISRARLASPMANYGNIYLQSTAKMQLLNADAPIFKRGLFTSATPLRRGAVWESVDPNADVKIMELSNITLEQFTSVMNYVDSNILSTMGVSGSNGSQNSAYQNSDAIQAQSQVKDLASAQVTAIIENAIRQYGLTGLDLYISEQVGKTALIIDDEAKNAINQINPPVNGVPFVGDDNIIQIDWEAYYARIHTWTVTVDLSIRRDQLSDKKRAELQDFSTVLSQTTDPNDPKAVATKNAVNAELVTDVAPGAAKAAEQAPVAQPQSMIPVGGEPTPQGQ
jgi:hypothetical protein